jgi:hypothetical protein
VLPRGLVDDHIAALPGGLLDAHGEPFAMPRRQCWSGPRGHDRGVSQTRCRDGRGPSFAFRFLSCTGETHGLGSTSAALARLLPFVAGHPEREVSGRGRPVLPGRRPRPLAAAGSFPGAVPAPGRCTRCRRSSS